MAGIWEKLFDFKLWFTQPSVILSKTDLCLGYFFAACVILAIVLKLCKRFSKNPVKLKLMDKFFSFLLSVGITGLVWFGFRYENTPIFAALSWAGLVMALGLIWFLFIVKYLIFGFTSELREYDRQLQKSKYIPGPKAR